MTVNDLMRFFKLMNRLQQGVKAAFITMTRIGSDGVNQSGASII